jgi:hypothetical protein
VPIDARFLGGDFFYSTNCGAFLAPSARLHSFTKREAMKKEKNGPHQAADFVQMY